VRPFFRRCMAVRPRIRAWVLLFDGQLKRRQYAAFRDSSSWPIPSGPTRSGSSVSLLWRSGQGLDRTATRRAGPTTSRSRAMSTRAASRSPPSVQSGRPAVAAPRAPLHRQQPNHAGVVAVARVGGHCELRAEVEPRVRWQVAVDSAGLTCCVRPPTSARRDG